MEPKNERHKHANTHSSKKIGFILEKSTKLSAQALRGSKLSSKRQDLTAVYILTSIDRCILVGSCL